MTNLIQDGATWLSGQLKNSAGRSITYRRGQLSTATITAVSSKNDYELVDEDNFRTTVQIQDWIVEPTDLTVRGSVITPRPGDRITETLSGNVVTYEVVPIGDKPCYEWVDTSGIMLQIHTQRVQ